VTIALDDALLEGWPLPDSTQGDKEERGRVLVIGGSPQIVGAVRLAGEAALRAGAGKLVIATVADACVPLAVAVPEARVIGWLATEAGGPSPDALDVVRDAATRAAAIVIGPGMQDETATCALAGAVLRLQLKASVVLDAGAMRARCTADTLDERRRTSAPRVIVTPHAGEMAHLTGRDKAAIDADPVAIALETASAWNAVVVLKGAITHVASPDGTIWRHEGGNAGLGVSGSGDVLAGLMTGLVARGASLEQAAVWAVRLHARAGERLAARFGVLGYLAREIALEVPAIMAALSAGPSRRIGFG
jgi:ADP-dependent NAD(P)H-hydrate dehydratase